MGDRYDRYDPRLRERTIASIPVTYNWGKPRPAANAKAGGDTASLSAGLPGPDYPLGTQTAFLLSGTWPAYRWATLH